MKNVLLISHSVIPSVLLCGLSQMQFLSERNLVNYRFIEAEKINIEDLSWSDIIVFVRSESDLEKHAAELCRNKKHLVYVLDDDLLNLPEGLSSTKYYALDNIRNNIIEIMKSCSVFLTTSRSLLNKYGDYFDYKFLIDEPSLDAIKKKEPNAKVKIGFAGSIDRTQDLDQILEESLIRIIEKYKDKIEIEFMGAKPRIVDMYNLEYIPYLDSYSLYSEKIREMNWDIGLAPMPDTDFHSCKYFNKYVEYASFGIVGIYSDCEPYIYGIKNEKNGLLVKNDTEEWFNAICRLIEDNTLRKEISDECILEANTIYSLENLSEDYLEKIETGYIEKERKEIKELWKYKVRSHYTRVVSKVKEQKWRLPFWMIKKIRNIIYKQIR